MGSLFGYEVRTSLPLERLRAEPGARGELAIRAGSDLLAEPAEITAYDDAIPGAAMAMAVAGPRVLLTCETTGDYRLDPPAAVIEVEAAQIDRVRWEHRLVATAVPLLLAERGDLALHAAGVVAPAGAVLFLGLSTRGKSTLALALAQLGFPLVGEDGIVVTADPYLAWPGPRGVRLKGPAAGWEPGAEHAGAGGARLVMPACEASGPVPVAALVALRERGERLVVERRDGADALPELVPSLFHHGGVEALRRPFAQLAGLAGTVPTWVVAFPDDLDALPAAAAEVLARVGR